MSSSGPSPATFTTSFSVPTTTSTGAPVQELVLEEIGADSCLFFTNAGENGAASIQVTTNGVPLSYTFPITEFNANGSGRSGVFMPAQRTRLYADAGTSVNVFTFNTDCDYNFSGYLLTK